MTRILVTEDDDSTRTLMCAILKRAGFDVEPAHNGMEALDEMDAQHIDLLVTDVMMPELDGFSLVGKLRDARIDMPVLMVTAKGQTQDRRQGFLVGTDDYLVKPFDAQEMVLRVKALLRRAKIVADSRIVVGDVELNYDSLTVSRNARTFNRVASPNAALDTKAATSANALQPQAVALPPKEFYLLYKLLAYPDKVFTRAQLLDEIWGANSKSDGSTVNVHINRLRARFADWPEFEIVTVRGLGYKAVHHA